MDEQGVPLAGVTINLLAEDDLQSQHAAAVGNGRINVRPLGTAVTGLDGAFTVLPRAGALRAEFQGPTAGNTVPVALVAEPGPSGIFHTELDVSGAVAVPGDVRIVVGGASAGSVQAAAVSYSCPAANIQWRRNPGVSYIDRYGDVGKTKTLGKMTANMTYATGQASTSEVFAQVGTGSLVTAGQRRLTTVSSAVGYLTPTNTGRKYQATFRYRAWDLWCLTGSTYVLTSNYEWRPDIWTGNQLNVSYTPPWTCNAMNKIRIYSFIKNGDNEVLTQTFGAGVDFGPVSGSTTMELSQSRDSILTYNVGTAYQNAGANICGRNGPPTTQMELAEVP